MKFEAKAFRVLLYMGKQPRFSTLSAFHLEEYREDEAAAGWFFRMSDSFLSNHREESGVLKLCLFFTDIDFECPLSQVFISRPADECTQWPWMN
jgi:hypothetical protein